LRRKVQMPVTSKESSRCIRPWPAASRLVKSIRRCPDWTDQELSNSRGARQCHDIPVNEPWPSYVFSPKRDTPNCWKLATLFPLKGVKLGGSVSSGLASGRNDDRVIFADRSPLLQFDYSFRPAPACNSRCLRVCFFGQPQLPRLMLRIIRRVIDVVPRNISIMKTTLYSKSFNYNVLYWCLE